MQFFVPIAVHLAFVSCLSDRHSIRSQGPALTASVEEVRLFLRDPVPKRPETELPCQMRTDLPGRHERHLVVDEDRRSRSGGKKLRLARALHRDEPPGGFLDGTADGEEPVIAQYHCFVLTECVGEALALFDIEHDAR